VIVLTMLGCGSGKESPSDAGLSVDCDPSTATDCSGYSGTLSYVGDHLGCLSDVPLESACFELWRQVELLVNDDEFSNANTCDCVLTFHDVTHILGTAQGRGGPVYHCEGEGGYDVVEFPGVDVDVASNDEVAYFDASGAVIAYMRRALHGPFCCENAAQNLLWWGRVMPVTCEGRYDYVPEDFTTPPTTP
jgi:hypothetical protein